MFLFRHKWNVLCSGHKDFAQQGAVRYLLGEEPKSPSFTMGCCVSKLCLLTTGEKNSSGGSLRALSMVQKATLRKHLWFGDGKGVLVCVLLLVLWLNLLGRGESAHGMTPLWPGWARRLKLPLGLRQAERVGNFQPEDEKALGRP